MPTAVTLQAVVVWFAMGFFLGLGWTLAAVLVNRVVR